MRIKAVGELERAESALQPRRSEPGALTFATHPARITPRSRTQLDVCDRTCNLTCEL